MRVTSEEMLNGPVGSVLVRMTIPMVIAIQMMILFQVVDTYFVGLLGTVELAAISFTFPVTFILVSLVIGLGIATSVQLAKAIGQGKQDVARRITTDSILLTVIVAIVVSIGGILTVDPLFKLLGATEQTLGFIHDYMDIWYFFIGLMIVPMIGNSAIRATGDTKWPSIVMIISGLINAVLDPVLIFGIDQIPAMGVKGAAVATVISWMLGLCMSLWILRVREKLLSFDIPDLDELQKYARTLFKMGIPISIANMLTPISAAILTALIARYGEHVVAGFGAGSRIEAFFLVVSYGSTASLSPYMVQNLWARNFDRARKALKLSIRFVFVFQLALYPLIYVLAPTFAGVFSSDAEVLEVAILFLRIMPLGFCFYSVLIIFNTGFNAAHQSNKTLVVSLIRVFACCVPLAWLGGLIYGVPGIFIGSVVGNGVAALIGWQILKKCYNGIEDHAIFKVEKPHDFTTAELKGERV